MLKIFVDGRLDQLEDQVAPATCGLAPVLPSSSFAAFSRYVYRCSSIGLLSVTFQIGSLPIGRGLSATGGAQDVL